MVDPKIGFAVICRCRDGQQALEVLSVRRDHPSQAPGKWSFPGGKLAAGEDSEEKRILAKVETQCAGGDPLGLPPLIHIIRLYNESSTKVRLQILQSVCVNTSADRVAVLLFGLVPTLPILLIVPRRLYSYNVPVSPLQSIMKCSYECCS